jgi:hypothetical protein
MGRCGYEHGLTVYTWHVAMAMQRWLLALIDKSGRRIADRTALHERGH